MCYFAHHQTLGELYFVGNQHILWWEKENHRQLPGGFVNTKVWPGQAQAGFRARSFSWEEIAMASATSRYGNSRPMVILVMKRKSRHGDWDWHIWACITGTSCLWSKIMISGKCNLQAFLQSLKKIELKMRCCIDSWHQGPLKCNADRVRGRLERISRHCPLTARCDLPNK